jgi:hypothetical protein
MRVFENIGPKYATIAHLPVTLVYKVASSLVPDETRQEILAPREAGDQVDEKEVKEIVSTAIREAKRANKIAAEEAKGSPAAKAKRKAQRQRQRAQAEAGRAKYLLEVQREQEAEKLVKLILQKFGSEVEELRILLGDLRPYGLVGLLQDAIMEAQL